MNAPMMLQPEPVHSDEDRARADHYALLARLFQAAPDEALLAALVEAGSALGEPGGSAFQQAWAALGEAAAATDAGRVGEEFDALFVSVSKPRVMLNASWYLTGFLQEEPLADLRADLAELGLGRRRGVSETEDHLAAIAEVMRHLVLTGPDEAGLARQRRFFARYLAPWFVPLADALATTPDAHFYPVAGSLLRAFLELEREAFDMIS
ncbi:MAG: molecular chaperone TorD family protein [Thauera phenolivorans]|uniref:Molecular chaperone TorD family protein n=1 Tax=Thauera phenolivorans TaxID=1792543 RepID=A0A7X7R7B3_9RHOO|nr:molecular chaperone TorD family protein [Thauera phenolivorans]NLF53381.1 molecular chaperone TorD family protein [Thauera phenolivorans]